MKKVLNKDLKVGDYFYNEYRKFKGLITSFNYSINGKYSTIRFIDILKNTPSYYFYDNENMFLLEEDEIEEFKEEQEIKPKYKAVVNLDRNYGLSMGSDPECFVVNEDNEVIPSYEFLKSRDENDTTSIEGHIMGSSAIQYPQPIFWDGFQAEFNVQANTCLGWMHDSLFLGLRSLAEKAKKYDKNAKLTIQSTLDINPRIMQDAKPEHVEFGCMPSFNIYGHEGIKKAGRDVPYRSAGGHIHFGFGDLKRDKPKFERYVKTLDKILGVSCVSLFAKYDKAERRKMYGLAGEYRTPKHGLEYRTLSNAWLSHPLISNMVFELARRCLSMVDADLENQWDATEEETIDCINNCDVELAREILARNKALFTNLLFSHCRLEEVALSLYKIYMLGIDSIIDNPEDIEGNWKLNTKGKWIGHCGGEGMQIYRIKENKKYKELENEKVTEIYEELVKEIKAVGETIIEEKSLGKKKA